MKIRKPPMFDSSNSTKTTFTEKSKFVTDTFSTKSPFRIKIDLFQWINWDISDQAVKGINESKRVQFSH